MKRVCFITGLCIILGSAALSPGAENESADWTLFAVSGSEASDDTRHFYNTKTLTRTPEGIVRVWEKESYSTTEDVYREHRVLWEIDIPGKKARMLSMIAVLRDGDREIQAPCDHGTKGVHDAAKLGKLFSLLGTAGK